MTATTRQIKELICKTYKHIDIKAKTRQLYNAALRAEVDGASEMMDEMETLYKQSRSLPSMSDRDNAKRDYIDIADQLDKMRDQLINNYKERVENGET